MTARTVVELTEPAFVWLDIVRPSKEELAAIADKYGLHYTSVQDCLEPEHLPKFEAFEAYNFVILRAWDEESAPNCTTVQEVTRKLAVFQAESFLITIHRTEQGWLSKVQQRLAPTLVEKRRARNGRDGAGLYVLSQLLDGAVDTYLKPMEAVETQLDEFEQKVFVERTIGSRHFRSELREIRSAKRQVTLAKRLLWRMVDVAHRLTPNAGKLVPIFRDVQENVESYHFYADELLDDANTLLNVQLSLASHRSGEVMRILTLFSAFFLPLTFIVGVYGMNFQFMPELRARWGYPAVLIAMALVCLGIYYWFRRRGWIR
jgi:magnesium transporter